MSMIFCRGCGKEIHESAISCPHCGAPQGKQSSAIQSEGQPWSTGRMMTYGLFSFFLPLIGVIAGIVGLLKEPTRKQGAILLVLALGGIVMYSSIFKGGMPSDSTAAKPIAAQSLQQILPVPEKTQTPAATDQTVWTPVNTAALVGKGAGHIISDQIERSRYSKLIGNDTELDDYLAATLFSDDDASSIQDIGDYLVIISKGIRRSDTGPMDGAYAINKTTGKPTAILLKDSKFTVVGGTMQSLPPPLKKWAKENGAEL